MANAVSSVDVPLSIFGSWDTELSPPDIPEGASPANNDVVYLPGSVATRPGLNRVFASAIPGIGPVTYEKSFVTPTGTIKNLYLTSGDGKLWIEDVTNSPGTVTLLFQSTGCISASSVTAIGREYIALSDGVHGADVPIQYDGTNLYRVTQDAPGAPPTVASIALPPSTMTTISTRVDTILQIFTSGLTGGHYTNVIVSLAAPDGGIMVGQTVTVAGSSVPALNRTYTVSYVFPGSQSFMCPFYSAINLSAGGGTATFPAGITASRANNTVSISTSSAHSLQVGYLVQISGVSASQVGGGITTIVLNNEDNPGIATVTTNVPHGLLPNNQVSIAGVNGSTVGGGISNVAFGGGFVTITTSSDHGLSVGSEVQVSAITATAVNGQWAVAEVPSSNTFTYAFNGAISNPTPVNVIEGYNATDTGTVSYIWPLASVNPAQNFFTVETAPTPTSFTISLSYTDGTWIGGTVSFPWDGIFFVTEVGSPVSFQYQQYGPDSTTSDSGTVTPYGQATPGIHQCRVSGLLPSGAITAPSPQVTFVANGGQYISITNLPIGPNWVGRVIQFTGSGGAYFFYIPVPAQVNGLVVSTATQVNDNTTTSIILDFSDNTLYQATATSIPGNNLAGQAVLGPCAGFFSYASRLLAWGERNKVQNFLNTSFDGGVVAPLPNNPLGWNPLDAQGTLVPSRLGTAWHMAIGTANTPQGRITQSAYLDSYGAPILLGNITYTVRVQAVASVVSSSLSLYIGIQGNAGSFNAFNIYNSIPTSRTYLQQTFNVPTPSAIPTDMILYAYAQDSNTGTWVEITELELIYSNQPFTDNISRISYAENLEGFDQLTGVIGPQDDLSPIRNFGVIRQSLYMVTGTGMHETQDNQQSEPSTWDINQIADNCGAFSIAAVSRNPQGVGSAGKDWMIWNGPDGAQIFTGQKPWKVSQEIQGVWDDLATQISSVTAGCWVKNDESSKRCYFGIPAMSFTGPPPGFRNAQVLVLDYRNIDGAMIYENPPIHISFTGKMIVSDLTRKWTQWTMQAACGELMYRVQGLQPQMVFGVATNAYTLNGSKLQDDDFGVIPASYTTYFFVSHEMEQALQVGSHRHIYTMAQAFISGVGTWTITPLAAALTNPFPTSAKYPLSVDPHFDVDFGINVETTRCAFRIQAQPISPSLDSYFKINKLVINIAPAPWSKVRGSTSGLF